MRDEPKECLHRKLKVSMPVSLTQNNISIIILFTRLKTWHHISLNGMSFDLTPKTQHFQRLFLLFPVKAIFDLVERITF